MTILMAKYFLLSGFLIAFVFSSLIFLKNSGREDIFSYIAGPFFKENVTPESLTQKYKNGVIKILIVPGHDNESFGAGFKNIRESDLNIRTAYHLFDFLSEDEKFAPFITRERDGSYKKWFSDYVASQETAIKDFRRQTKIAMNEALLKGEVKAMNNVFHNPAADNMSLNLYAVNKWANDSGADIVIHIHFNDYPGRRFNVAGEYSGFAIYVPESQLPNSRASIEIAKSIKKAMGEFFPGSNLPQEFDVVVEDLELIAVGSNASRDGASFLMEYGYIYETQHTQEDIIGLAVKEYAFQTYKGIKKYFDPEKDVSNKNHDTSLFPYRWSKSLNPGEKSGDILSLQAALLKEGHYPPNGRTLSDCPISGYYGDCTVLAVKSFQDNHKKEILEPNGLSYATGVAGQATLGKLNSLYDY